MTRHAHLSAQCDAYRIGVTLYQPAIHPKANRAIQVAAISGAGSVVLCFEDAVCEREAHEALAHLSTRFETMPRGDARLFLRPRDLEMARRIADLPYLGPVEGFVAPKVTISDIGAWAALARRRGLSLMPTLESPSIFEPGALAEMRDALVEAGSETIATVRIGGADLLGALGLRRPPGAIAAETPLGAMLNMAAAMFMPAGLPLAAPVFDLLEDRDTLAREAAWDAASGFVSKTAVHPTQVAVIRRAFQPSEEDMQLAHAILAKDAKAVFKKGGVMCEPAVHAGWAQRMLARARVFGVDDR